MEKVRLQFSVTGFYQPSTMTQIGKAVLFEAPSVEDGKRMAYDMLLELSTKDRHSYPSPKVRTDWERHFFAQTWFGERVAEDLGFTNGNYAIKSFVVHSGGPRKSPDILFMATPETAESIGAEILRKVCDLGYLSFPDPKTRTDWAIHFLENVE